MIEIGNARSSSLEDVLHRFGHRLPRLIIGLLGAILSADIMGRFEGVLSQHIMQAFFIPGLVLAAAAFLLILWRWANVNAAFGIGLFIFGACSKASATAMMLPWILNRIGLDPAYGSGPISTVIQDLLSILIYFAIATRFF